MTPSFVPDTFERVMGCSADELVSWLPRALPGAALHTDARAQHCAANWGNTTLTLHWQTLPARRIALLEIPQLAVRFAYSGVSEADRYRIQKCFDLQTHRGGG